MIRRVQLTDEQKSSLRELYDQIVHVKMRWGGDAYIKRSMLRSRIEVNVKTFHGQRKTHKVNVSIIDLIDKIREKLQEIEPNEMGLYHTVKLVYPMGHVKILPLDQTVESQNLPNNSTLVLMGMSTFVWDSNSKEAGIEIDKQALRATRLSPPGSGQGSAHATVLATRGFESGRHYWEVTLNTCEN